jgi:hypothetical protein
LNPYLLPSVVKRHPFFRLLVIAFLFVGWGCQPRVEPVAPHFLKDSITTGYVLKRQKDRAGKIKNLKSFSRTTFQNRKQKQSIRQTVAIQDSKSIRVDTFGLFGQAMGIFTHHKGKTVFFDPAKERYYSGKEVESLMQKMLGMRLDFREHLRIFVGHIPRLEFLKVLDSSLNSDRTKYILWLTDVQRGGQVTISFSAATLLPMKMTRKLGQRSVYSVTWQDYAKVGDHDFAHLVTLSFPEKQETIRIKYKNPVINQGLPMDTFQFMQPDSSLKSQ